MSTTIGIGCSPKNNIKYIDDLKALVDRFGYGLYDGIEFSEPDVKSGLVMAQKNEGWEHLLFLQSPKGSNVSLAFGIEEELIAFETKGEWPVFFDFINQLVVLSSGKCKKIGIFFASEWYEKDRIRYSYGTADDLISLLSMPGHWGIRYLIPETGRLQDSDDIPLIFDLKFD
ncbi:hypothetical protein MNBD_GAMMA08-1241 [hydrothermal vent metagenome]|uniref:Uncharacterized protein n=1 Tax=hydrothermal vent metagenome TaxID=652676 RepID=A0A3B0XEL6_9ZZZZ